MAVLSSLISTDFTVRRKPNTLALPQDSNLENYLRFVCFPVVIFSCVSTHKVTHQNQPPASAGGNKADYFNIGAYLNPTEAINLMVSLAQYVGDVCVLEIFQYLTFSGVYVFYMGEGLWRFYLFLCIKLINK